MAVCSVPVKLVATTLVAPILPTLALPLTFSDPRVPTDVKLDVTTLLAKNVPVNVSAFADEATTPVN